MMTRFSKAIAMVGAIMLAAAPAQADVSDKDVETVFNLAKLECPAVLRAPDAGLYMSLLIEESDLNDSQAVLLIDFCITYGEGMKAGVMANPSAK